MRAAWIVLVACTPVKGSGNPREAPPPPQILSTGAPKLVERPAETAPPVAPRIELDVETAQAYRALAPHDPRLDAVARDLARVADAGGSVDKSIGDRLLHLHGIVEAAQHVAVAATREELDKQFAAEQSLANARLAIARTTAGVVGIVVYQAFVNLEDVPRSGGSFSLTGTIATNMTDPRITIDGKARLALVRDGRGFHGELSCPSPGQHSIAIDVTDPARGTSPRLLFPVYCGVAPKKITSEPIANIQVAPEQIPDRLVGILDRERVAVSLPVLHHNRLLEHATATLVADRAKGIASAVEAHAKRANLLNPFVQFTIVHGETFSDAVGQILDDSRENEKLYDGHNTDVAISVSAGSDGYWIAVGYLAVPTIHDLDAVQRIIAKRVIAIQARRVHDRTSNEEPELTTAATMFARNLALGRAFDDVKIRFGRTYGHYKVAAAISIDLDNYDIEPLVAKYDFEDFGLGLAQAPQDGPAAGLVYIVIYFAPVSDSDGPFDPNADFAHRKPRSEPKDPE